MDSTTSPPAPTARAVPLLRPPEAVRADARALGRTIVGLAVGLTAFGLVMVYSWTAVKLVGYRPAADADRVLLRQAAWAGIAIVVGIVASRVPLSFLRKHADALLFVLLLLLGATLVPGLGRMRNNSRRWLEVGPLGFQPSELLKIAVVLYLADRLARREDAAAGDRLPWLALLSPVAIGVGLVLLEPDLGTSLFVAALTVVMLGLAGMRPGRLLPFAAIGIPSLVAVAASKFHHVNERLGWFANGAKADPQQWHAVIAVGSGGWMGAGLGAGTQKLGYVPEMQNDFIFALVGEEMGFVGCAAVILAFMAFVVYGRRIAERAHASAGLFPYFLAVGATFAVAFQALINMAVATGSAPNKGVSLPFISAGGSNLVTAFTCVGLLVNVSRAVAAEEAGDPWS
jgi:cell division protein FtsW